MPSLTEDLCAIGAGKQLAGVSKYSSDIPCARSLPAVNDATSIDAERILSLHPDAVVGIPAQRLMTAQLARAGVNLYLLRDDSYGDIFSDIAKLGDLSGHAAQARTLTLSLHRRTQSLQRAQKFGRKPAVFVVLQTNPIWTVGPQSYVSTLIALAGARNAVASLPSAYAQFSAEELVRLQPDALIASQDSGLGSSLDRQPWISLKAVRARRVYLLKDASLLYRPGPRYNEAVAWLMERLNAQKGRTGLQSTAPAESPTSAPAH